MFDARARSFCYFRAIAKVLSALVWIWLAFGLTGRAGSARDEQIWLAVSDIHLNIFDRSSLPSPNATDANRALFQSALDQMADAVRNPAVVLLPGDFLMHNFKEQVAHNGGSPDEGGLRTMRWIARALERAFPKAQFALALGNNDVPCGDYRSDAGSAYLVGLARVWSPLVDRDGAAPDFAASFARGGYYTVRLPVRGLRLVVLNTVLLSNEYRGGCAGDDYQAASQELAWLRTTLQATPRGVRNIVMMHAPPGVDAFSTDYLHGFLTWPFLKARYNGALVGALAARGDRVAFAIAGHAHRFDFRLAGGVPIVVIGSLSPIYGNNPAFYALRVSADGLLGDISTYAFDESILKWLPSRSFDDTWDVRRIDALSLLRLHARLANFPAMRAQWDEQANGWPTDPNVALGIWHGNRWRVAWCAQSLVIADFARCARIAARVTALHVLIGVVVAVVVVTMLVVMLRSRMTGRRL